MKPNKKGNEAGASQRETLWLILAFSMFLAFSVYADPSWWSSPGTGTQSAVIAPQVVTNNGVVTTNYAPQPYAAVNQGQLKHFTVRAVDALNSGLPGGAGTNLNTLVQGWAQDYASNGYTNNTNNPYKPSDYTAINVGQLKYIGNLVWAQLVTNGYTNAVPTWLHQNTNTDNQLANIGQLKQVFAFDLSTNTQPVTPTPTDSLPSGTYGSSQTVTLTVPTGATVYYTLDGSTPTTNSAVYTGPITISGTTTLKYIAVETGHSNSPVTTVTYTFVETAPTFSPASGTYATTQTVTLTGPTGSTVFYTTDGTIPGINSTVYTSPLSISTTTTLKAIAAQTGYTTSSVASATYTIDYYLGQTPVLIPISGNNQNAVAGAFSQNPLIVQVQDTHGNLLVNAPVTFTASATGLLAATTNDTPVSIVNVTTDSLGLAQVYTYSTDGSAATVTATAGPANGTQAQIVFNVSAEQQSVAPTLSLASGTYNSAQTVTITGATGATFYYTTDGSTPTTSSTAYTGPITISSTTTILQAITIQIGYTPSSVVSATYTIQQQSSDPTSVSGLTVWLKADAGVSTNAVGVTGWTDQSGNNYTVTQNTSGQQPTLVSNVLNGKPVLRWTGSQQLSSAAQIQGLNADMTIITVGSTTAPSAQAYSVFLGVGDNTAYAGQCRSLGYESSQQLMDASFVSALGASSPNAGTYAVEACTLDSTLSNIAFYRNGTQTATGTLSSVGSLSSGISIGNDTTASYGWQGDIAEVLVYNHQLSTSEFAQINLYLANKYGFYNSDANWITAYPANIQALINLYKWSKSQTDQYSWISTYSSAIQVEILKHNWTQAQAANYVAFQSANPNMLTTGLSMWFKADNGVSQDGSGNVTSWADQTGNYTVTQTGTTSPTYVASDLNSKPALRFNGTQFLTNPAQVDNGFNTDLTIITVASTTNPSAQQYGAYLGGSAGSDARGIGYYGALQDSDYYYNNVSGSLAPSANTFVVETTTLASDMSTVAFYRNGLQTATGTVNGALAIAPGVYIGSGPSGYGGNWQGDIAEVLVYDHQLSSDEMSQVNLYLANKYNLYNSQASWISSYPANVQELVNQYQLSQTQADQYGWIVSYSSSVQVEILKQQWTQAQADSYVTFQTANPNMLTTGLTAWFKADSGVTVDSSGNVSGWTDQTGNYSVSQNTTSLEPMLVSNVLNGKPVLRWTGSQQLAAAVQADPGLNADMTIITVGSTTAPSAQAYAVFLGIGNNTAYAGQCRSLGYEGSQQWMDASFVGAQGASVPNAGSYVAEACSIDSTLSNIVFYRNGVQTAAGSFTGAGDLSSGIAIGNDTSASYGWQGDIAEVLVYDHQLSAAEWQQVGQYIGDKYGLYNPNATWINSYPSNVQALINQYQWSKPQADQYGWIAAYASPVQAEIVKHNWTSAQANNYVAMQTNNPNVLSTGLSMWFKADNGVAQDGSGNVTSWGDQTGNYTVTQTGAACPTYVASDLNNEPALHFNGTQFLTNPAQVDNGFNSDLTIITVSSSTNPSAQQYSTYLGGSAYADGRGIGYYGSQQNSDYYFNNTLGAIAPNPSTFVIEATTLASDLSTVAFYRNGSQTATGMITGVMDIAPGANIGSSPTGYGAGWQGDIAEVLVYDHQLSSDEMNEVSIYLANKYNLAVTLSAPTITPNGGVDPVSMTVSITGSVSPAVICYTLDGSTPVNTSPVYTGSLTLTQSTQLNAAIFLNGTMISPVATAQFYVADTDQLGISDAWQLQYFGYVGIDPNTVAPNGITYLQCYQNHLDPTSTNTMDSNGLSYAWEIQYFGKTGINASTSSPAGDGLTILQEYQQGRNPLNHYQGKTPVVIPISGNNQSVLSGSFSSAPLVVQVQDGNGNLMANAPVTFTISGTGLIAATTGDIFPASTLSLQTDSLGLVQVYAQMPDTASNFTVTATAGSASVTLNVNTLGDHTVAPAAPSNVTVTTNPDGSSTYTWQNNSNNEDYIAIQQQRADGTWVEVARVGPGQTSCTVPAAAP